jgi:cell wall-associated NlpC family hydrolase
MTPNRDQIVAEARSWIGTPYRHQASLKGVGCDCLGLVRGVWRALIGDEPQAAPPYSRDWAEALGEETLAKAARAHLIEISPSLPSPASPHPNPPPLAGEGREGASGGGLGWGPGDVLLFRYRARYPAKHAAIVTAREPGSPALMVHAHDGAAVAEVAIAPWWRRRLAYAFRFPGILD